jgi:hypothetical protein
LQSELDVYQPASRRRCPSTSTLELTLSSLATLVFKHLCPVRPAYGSHLHKVVARHHLPGGWVPDPCREPGQLPCLPRVLATDWSDRAEHQNVTLPQPSDSQPSPRHSNQDAQIPVELVEAALHRSYASFVVSACRFYMPPKVNLIARSLLLSF